MIINLLGKQHRGFESKMESQQFFLRTIAALFVDSIAPVATRRYP